MSAQRTMDPPAAGRPWKTKPLEHNMFEQGHRMYAWIQLPLILLGGWLATSPFILGYESRALAVNDVVCGMAVMALGFLGLNDRRFWTDLANIALGVWLLFAPLAFWAPTAGAYANETLVGALLVTFALLVPMLMPMKGGDVPPGWTYNPSTWMQRAPLIFLGFTSFLMARHMAAFQLGHIGSAWDPVFGNGTEQILQSDLSKAWPVSDAGLGAMIYLVELLSMLMGDRRRWRTMPWMVAIFGFAVVPLGIVSIFLVIMQPVAVGTWCFLCLVSALFMLLMIPLSLDEIVAMLQFLRHSRRRGRSLVSAFFLGGTIEDGPESEEVRPDYLRPRSMVWGVTPGWHLVLASLVGALMMAAPDVLGGDGTTAGSVTVVAAALIVTVSVIAMADVVRGLQIANVPLAFVLVAGPWLGGGSQALRWTTLAAGVLIAALSVRRFRLLESYDAWTNRIAFVRRAA